MQFLHPELLALALPAAWVVWSTRNGRQPVTILLRALVALCLVLALARPLLRTLASGRDLIIVVDRSKSMPDTTDETALELVRLAEEQRKNGDRVGIVSFGARPRIDRLPSEEQRFAGFSDTAANSEGSDLAAALQTALDLLPGDRPGSLLLLSDGEADGDLEEVRTVARRAFARGVRIDSRTVTREGAADLSVASIDLPEETTPGEPFQFGAWVRSDAEVEADWELQRDGQTLTRGRRTFAPGMNRLTFRDRIGSEVESGAGISSYSLRLTPVREADGSGGFVDRIPENDAAVSALRVRGARSLLVVNDDGGVTPLVQALRGAGMPVMVETPESARLDLLSLAAHRAVVLENVSANRVSSSLVDLRDFVLERGGGLLMTGGQASFGVGGYHLSALDEILPVSMEMRQEDRKLSVAMAIAMDRSGSMSAAAGSGTKMDLANLGASAAIELLSPMDAISVIAVDSAPHVIQPLVSVADKQALISTVRSIQSMGGGIYVYSALLAAGRQLENASQQNRHIILFSDAADSEEQEGCDELVAALGEMNTSLSVIALGTETDSDADFLKRIAAIGGGEIYFTMDAAELPRLFAQDTLRVARSSFIEERTGVRTSGGQIGLGELALTSFPDLTGYNLSYLREGALPAAVTTDEYAAPIVSYHYRGLGRAAAYTGQVGGSFGQDVVEWSEFSGFFATLARWLAGQEEPREVFAEVRREGAEAVVSVEIDPDAVTPPDAERMTIRMRGPEGDVVEKPLVRVGARRFEARTELTPGGVTLGAVRMGEVEEDGAARFVSLPPVTLPYSPEFEARADAKAGERLVKRVSAESGGDVGVGAAGLFRGEREGRRPRAVTRELLLAGLVLLVLEIAGRRLQLWGWVKLAGVGRKRDEDEGLEVAVDQEREVVPSRDRDVREGENERERVVAAPEVEGSVVDALRKARKSADRKTR